MYGSIRLQDFGPQQARRQVPLMVNKLNLSTRFKKHATLPIKHHVSTSISYNLNRGILNSDLTEYKNTQLDQSLEKEEFDELENIDEVNLADS